MSNDKIKGFLYGMSAGFLIASFLKSADEMRTSPGDQARDADAKPAALEGIIRLTADLRGRRQKTASVGA